MQRRKGARGELEFLRHLGSELGEMLQRNLSQTRDSGADCIQLKGYAIEVKRQEKLSRPKWWKQAKASAAALGVEPIMAYRQNRKPWAVWMRSHKTGQVEEMTVAECAGEIREKWLRWP